MLRKYTAINLVTGYPCFGGRRFFTAKGAARKIAKSPFAGWIGLYRLENSNFAQPVER